MKFRLYAAILGLSAAFFAACDNGNYDAQPSVDGSQVQNPINPSLPAAKGNLKVRVNGQFYTFGISRFSLQDSFMQVTSIDTTLAPGDPLRIIELAIRPYKGARTYPLNDTNGVVYFAAAAYAELYGNDTTLYNTRWDAKKGSGEVKVDMSSAGEVKGSFNFTAFREKPASVDDKVVITDGTFWATPE